MLNQNEAERLNKDGGNELTINKKCENTCSKLLKITKQFASQCDGHLEHIISAEHFTELINNNVCQVNDARHKARTATRHFAATEIVKMLQKKIIKQAAKERTNSYRSL